MNCLFMFGATVQEVYAQTHPRRAMFHVPELDISVADRHEVTSVLSERDRLYFGADLVTGHLNLVFPVPYVYDHIMLAAHANYVFSIRRKRLKEKKTCKTSPKKIIITIRDSRKNWQCRKHSFFARVQISVLN